MVTVGGAFNAINGFVAIITPWMNKVVIFFFILFIGFLIGKIVSRLTGIVLRKVDADAFGKRISSGLSLERLVTFLVAMGIYLASILIAVRAVGLAPYAVSFLTFAFAIVLALSFLAATRYFLPNLVAAIGLRREGLVGMRLRVERTEGIVTKITLLDTTIRTPGGETVILPNVMLRTKMRVLRGMEAAV